MSGGAMRRRANMARNKQYRKARKTSRRTKDIDQIVLKDMLPEETEKLTHQEIDENLPGLGQFYCVTCARYFISQHALNEHFKTKQHKKRFKECTQTKPYTVEEAERAGGLFNKEDPALYAQMIKK